ncbi:hypothetical protein HMPREF9999_01026 [Alloprevotella sp. oral taxon 473 str. F0040]|nr:hypothetical protein HMPREF9999_01026 [Alloprevotella sp. oral taxon 473 str. F0040]
MTQIGELWGIMRKFPISFEPFKGKSYLCRKTNLSTDDDRNSPFSA